MFFATRLRCYARYHVLQHRPLPQGSPILSDEIIRLGSPTWHTRVQVPLRRITVWLPDRHQSLVLLTNLLHFSPRTVAEIYRERWQIEVFFRALDSPAACCVSTYFLKAACV